MMRVLQIIEATGAGVARHVVDLSEGLAKHGLEVHLVYSPLRMDRIWIEGLVRLREAGVQIWKVPMRRAPHFSDIGALGAILGYLQKAGPFHIVHGHSSKGGGMARLLKLIRTGKHKVVYTPNALITMNPQLDFWKKKIYALIEKFLAHKTDAFIAVSKKEAQEAFRLGYPESKIHLIYNGVHLNYTSSKTRNEVRVELSLNSQDLVVGFVGRFSQQKAPDILLEAFARVAPAFSNAKLVMVGDGPLKESLANRIRILGLENRVIFPGFIEGRIAMRAFDVFVLSSLYEGFPYVILEAMAEGIPVVTTSVGGVEEAIVDGENGFVIPVKSVDDLTRALFELLKSEGLREKFGKRSRERVRRFSVEEMVNATLRVYQSLLA